MRRCLRDPTFSRFDTIPECDRQTHRHTHRHTTTANTALSIASRGNETQTLEYLPDCRKVIPSKWVYTSKQNPDGSVDRFKARLVVKGCSQRRGLDYGQTFSPVAWASSIKAVMSTSASQKMVLTLFYVSTAFFVWRITGKDLYGTAGRF